MKRWSELGVEIGKSIRACSAWRIQHVVIHEQCARWEGQLACVCASEKRGSADQDSLP